MQTIATRAGKVAVHIQGEGPPLFLLHSVGHDHHDFDLVVPSLSRQFQTIAVDWPGHGASDMWDPPEAASARGLFEVLEDVVDALNLPPAIFIGNSVGGAASLRLAWTRPERVRGLVLVDNGGAQGRSRLVSAACWVQGQVQVRRWTGMRFAATYLRTKGPGRDAVLAKLAEHRERPGFIEMESAMWRSFGAPANNLAALARHVRVPTLIVWGKHDPVLLARLDGRRMQKLMPHARYVELATGHAPFVEKPEAFLAAITPFLEATSAAAPAPRGKRAVSEPAKGAADR
jgi:pimeloyl-ACP methyl ester carboxylesterase